MEISKVLQALSLPECCLVNQRIPKTILTAQAAAGSSDKRFIRQSIEVINWIAALKPETIGVVAYRDELREYLEIAVLHVSFRQEAKAPRLIELIHRAIPYPVLLIVALEDSVSLSVAHKRWAQNDREKMVLEDGFPQTTEIPDDAPDQFFSHLNLSSLPQQNMFSLYSGWIDALTALEAFYISGSFAINGQYLETKKRRKAIFQIRSIEKEITRLKKLAAKETQMSRLVDLNLDIKSLQASLKKLMEKV